MIDRIAFLTGEALIALKRNGLLTLAAVTTVAVSLFLIGGFGYLFFRAEAAARSLPSQLEIRSYFKDGVPAAQVEEVKHKTLALPGVASVTTISKEEAWQKMRQQYPDIAEGLDNPLPDALQIKLKNVDSVNNVASSLQQNTSIDKVLFPAEVVRLIQQALSVLKYIGYFGFLLFVISGILIYNAIRLTVVARRLEIRIMKLVGASQSTVLIPFMIEGLLQGIAGGLLAGGFLLAVNSAITNYLATIEIHVPPFPMAFVTLIMIGVGAVLGIFCSTIAVRMPLRFR